MQRAARVCVRVRAYVRVSVRACACRRVRVGVCVRAYRRVLASSNFCGRRWTT